MLIAMSVGLPETGSPVGANTKSLETSITYTTEPASTTSLRPSGVKAAPVGASEMLPPICLMF